MYLDTSRLIINKCSRYIKKVRMHTLKCDAWVCVSTLVQVVLYILVVIKQDSLYWLPHSSIACLVDLQFNISVYLLCRIVSP